MYLDYETYQALGGTVSEADYPASEAWAEAVLDSWTLNRMRSIDWSAWEREVQLVMRRLVDDASAIQSAERGSAISHFSNGVDSYTYADPGENATLAADRGYAMDVLPVDLVSGCVRWNGAS